MGSIFFPLKVDGMMIDSKRQYLTVLIYHSIKIPKISMTGKFKYDETKKKDLQTVRF